MNEYLSARTLRQTAWQKVLGSYEEVTKKIEDEWKKIEQGHKDLDAKKVQMAEGKGGSNSLDSDILDINAGGEYVRVRRGTLTQKKGTLLEALFSGRWERQLLRDSRGFVFLDVNPACFRCIVDYLNECQIAPPDSQPDLPRMDGENQAFLSRLLMAFRFAPPLVQKNDSAILADPYQVESFAGLLKKNGIHGSLKLLYRGTQDGMSAEKFHQKCDNQGPTITIVKTTDQNIFGGYADKAWTSHTDGTSVASDKTFLFSLRCCSSEEPTTLALKNHMNDYALYHCIEHGPNFGDGDLILLDDDVYNHFERRRSSFVIPSGWEGRDFEDDFSLEEMEVFAVETQTLLNKSLDELDVTNFPTSLQDSLQAETKALQGAAAELADLRTAFDKEQTAVKIFCGGDTSEIIHMNVNGRIMSVKKSTLAGYSESVFYKQYADPNWNQTRASRSNTTSPAEWGAEKVMEWISAIQGLSSDVTENFRSITGLELLALEREDVKDLGIERPGAVALVMKALGKLRSEEEQRTATFVEHSDYCIGKIFDHMRLKAMEDLNIPTPGLPEIREPYKKRFKRIVEYYFPTEEESARFLG